MPMNEHHVRFDVAGFSANPNNSESFDILLDLTETQMIEAFNAFRDMFPFEKLVDLFDQDGYTLKRQTEDEIFNVFRKQEKSVTMPYRQDLLYKMSAQIDHYETILQGFYITNQQDRSTMSNCVMLNHIEACAERYEGMNERINRVKDNGSIELIKNYDGIT